MGWEGFDSAPQVAARGGQDSLPLSHSTSSLLSAPGQPPGRRALLPQSQALLQRPGIFPGSEERLQTEVRRQRAPQQPCWRTLAGAGLRPQPGSQGPGPGGLLSCTRHFRPARKLALAGPRRNEGRALNTTCSSKSHQGGSPSHDHLCMGRQLCSSTSSDSHTVWDDRQTRVS